MSQLGTPAIKQSIKRTLYGAARANRKARAPGTVAVHSGSI